MYKGVLRNFTKFTGKHLCQGHFFNRPATLLKKRLWHKCFSVNFVKFLRTPFLQNTFPAGTATLWQRCHNAIVDVVTTLWHGRKWELYRRQFPTLWQRRSPTLSRRCYNVATTLSIGLVLGHFTMDYSDFCPFTETW